MSTQAPAPVQSFSDTSIEKIAYKSVESIPTQEPNDRSRLGYHVWLWLTTKEGTLEESVRSAGSRMLVSYAEAISIIEKSLAQQNIAA